MKRSLLLAATAAAALLAAVPAGAQTAISSTPRSVPNNAGLLGLSTIAATSVQRQGYATAGDAPPLTFTASPSACTLNAGAGDGGSQVPSADGKCWRANFPSGIDIRWFGAKSGVSTYDSTPAFLAALNAAVLLSGGTIPTQNDIYIPPGNWYMNATFQAFNLLVHGTMGTVILPFAANSIFNVNGASKFITFRDLDLAGNPSFPNTDGLVISGTTKQVVIDNVATYLFPRYGINVVGNANSSGNWVQQVSIINSQLMSSGSANVNVANAIFVGIRNNNFDGSGTSSSLSLSAGKYYEASGNFMFGGQRSVFATGVVDLKLTDNRLTFAGADGLDVTASQHVNLTGNQFITNGNNTLNTFFDASFTGVAGLTLSANQFFADDAVNHVKNNVFIDATSSLVNVTGNQFSNAATAPVSNASTGIVCVSSNVPSTAC